MTDLFEAGDQSASEREEILAKWKDKPAEEVLKAKVESDLYIKTLERQKDELRDDYLKQREELLAKAKFEDLLDRYEKQSKDQVAAPDANDDREPKFDTNTIEEIVSKKIQQNKLEEKKSSNAQVVQAKLRERYGVNTPTVLKEQAATLGLSANDVNELAEKSPEAFFRIMGLNEDRRENFQTPPRSNQRNDNFAPKGETKRTWSYYQELKKTNPQLYLDPKIAVQIHNDHQALGAAFEDGDFKRFG